MFDDAFKKSATKGKKMKVFLKFLSFLVYSGKGGLFRVQKHFTKVGEKRVSLTNIFISNIT